MPGSHKGRNRSIIAIALVTAAILVGGTTAVGAGSSRNAEKASAANVASIEPMATCPPGGPTGPGWSFETLDGGGGTCIDVNVGAYNAVLIFNGQPHVWYYDATGGNLRHGWWNGTAWQFETLDGVPGPNGRIDSNVGTFNAVLIFNGQPHVWYVDNTGGNLRHGWWNGTAWQFETLDGVPGPNGRIDSIVGAYSAALIYGGQPHVWYYDDTGGNLRHGWWNGTAWQFETLDGVLGPNGRIDGIVGAYSAALIYGGQPHVWYYALTGNNLRHGWWDGTAWQFETLDGALGPNGRIEGNVGWYSTVLIYNGQPHVWYYDDTGGNLRHGWWNGTAWQFETLDGVLGPNGRIGGIVGMDNAAIIYGGLPHVWYYDLTNGYLRHSWWNGTAWQFETLDGNGGTNGRINGIVGSFNAVLLYGGKPHVWYYDFFGGNLRHGWWN